MLRRLVEHGMVLAEQSNTGFMYRLNREHLLAPAILSAVGAPDELASRLATACRGLIPNPVHVSVFGSHARAEATAASDIDLMIVVDGGLDVHDARWTDQMDDLGHQVLTWTGNRLEVVVLSVTRLRAVVLAGEPLVETWAADARTLLGPRPQSLVRSARAEA